MKKLFLIIALVFAFTSSVSAQQQILKSSTSYPILFGPIIDSGDHISGKTGVCTTLDLLKISKGGGTGVTPSGSVTELDATNLPGWCKIAGNATDSGTDGPILVHAEDSTIDDFDMVAAVVVEFDPRSATTLQDIINGILDELCSTHTTAGTVCKLIADTQTKTGYLPSATAGAAGGVMIAGANAATTFATLTVTGNTLMSDGLTVNRATSNQSAIKATGNGTGAGIEAESGSGSVGDGIYAASNATAGSGMSLVGNGTGYGMAAASGTGATGSGIYGLARSTNGSGILGTGTGTGGGESISSFKINGVDNPAQGTDFNSTQKASIRSYASPAIQKNTAFEWPFQFKSSAGALVTTGTPVCNYSIDAPGSFGGSITASAANSSGISELTMSAAVTNGNYYVIVKCTLSGAVDNYERFKIQQ